MSLYVWDFQSGKKIKIQRYDKDTSLWYKAMRLVLIGLWFTSCSIHLMKLRIILPPIGMLLATLGFRMLRKSHPSFAHALKFHLLRCAFLTVALSAHFSLYRRYFVPTKIGAIGLILYGMISWVMLQQMQTGLEFVLKECNITAPKNFSLYVLSYTIYLCIALFFTFLSIPRTVPFPTLQGAFELPSIAPLFDYFCFSMIGYYTYRFSELLMPIVKDDYVLPPIKEKIPDKAVIAASLLGFFLILFFVLHFLQRHPMKWREVRQRTAEMREISADLLINGFPQQVLNDLSEEDLRLAENSSDIQVYTVEKGEEKEKIRFTTVFFRPYSSNQFRAVRHFRWLGEPTFAGTEAIHIFNGHFTSFEFGGQLSGRVLCRRRNKTVASPYSFLDQKPPDDGDEERDPEKNILYATFSFPRYAEEARGYVSYDVLGKPVKNEEYLQILSYCHQGESIDPIVPSVDILKENRYDTRPMEKGFFFFREELPFHTESTE